VVGALGLATSGAVKELQSDLAEVGLFHGTANGVYGSETFEAVQALQRQTHIRVDGLFGPASAVGLGVLYLNHQDGISTSTTTSEDVAGISTGWFGPQEQAA
jgi:peptidoglycan hydrolase-like protein with peptidoglycan-binding domain